jgi:hypothetical protein
MSLHEYYSNPMDIVQFLEGEKAEKIMLSVLHSAALFHADTGLSPIVKSDKYDSYMLDYFFLVSKVSDFVYDAFLGRDKQLAEDAKNQIMDDFGMKSDQNNKRLLINLLDYKGVMYSNSDKRWVYSLKRYRGKFNDKLFLISGVAMDGNFIKERLSDVERERLEKMSDSSQYVLEAIGNKAMQVNFSASANQPVWSFS